MCVLQLRLYCVIFLAIISAVILPKQNVVILKDTDTATAKARRAGKMSRQTNKQDSADENTLILDNSAKPSIRSNACIF